MTLDLVSTICFFCLGKIPDGYQEGDCPHCGAHLGLQRDMLPLGYELQQGQYRIERVLGYGGFGITYRAVDQTLQRPVAIKEFFPRYCARRHLETLSVTVGKNDQDAYQKALSRFEQEGRILAQINHPNVVRVYSLFRELNTAYLVMEFLEGHSLATELELRDEPKLSERIVKKIIHCLVDALGSTHERQIYHLDIKPDNIMITSDSRIILLDFGSARWLDQPTGYTQTSQAYTPEYAPLELIRGEPTGPETDIYEVGVLIYELLTGKRPPNVLERLKDGWEPDELEHPWRGLVIEALQIERELRPSDIRLWWYRGMGLEQNKVTRPARRSWRAQALDLYRRMRYSRGFYRWLFWGGAGGAILLLSYLAWIIIAENNVALQQRLAEQAVSRSDLQAALRHYSRALQLAPDGRLYEARGDVRYRLNDFQGAILDYREALRLYSGSPVELQNKLGRAYLSLGNYQQTNGDFSGAIISYQEAIKAHPPLREIALTQIQQARFGQAVQAYENLDYTTSIRLHREILQSKDLSTEFTEQVRNSLAQVLLDYGRALAENEKPEALTAFTEGLRLEVSQKELKANLYKYRALEYIKLNKYVDALADYNAALGLVEHPDYYQGRGFVHGQMGNYFQSVSDYTKALQLGGESPLIYLGRGESSLRLKDYRAAAEDFNKVLEAEPNNVLALVNRGWALHYLKSYRQSALDFQKATEIEPSLAEAYEGGGYSKFFLGDRRGAIRDLQRAIELYRQQKREDKLDRLFRWAAEHNINLNR